MNFSVGVRKLALGRLIVSRFLLGSATVRSTSRLHLGGVGSINRARHSAEAASRKARMREQQL
jgi:hypothetical protein